MEGTQNESGFDKFRKTPAAKVLGAILAIAVGIFLFYSNVIQWCCVGVLLVGIVVFAMMKIFAIEKTKLLLVLGIVFLLVTTAVGAFAVSKPIIDNNGPDSFNSEGFSDVEFVYNDGTLTVSAAYTGGQALSSVDLYIGEVAVITYKVYNYYGKDSGEAYKHTMAESGGVYSCTISGIGSEKVYGFKFVGTYDTDKKIQTSDGFYKCSISDGNYALMLLYGNLYYVGLATLMFVVIVLFTSWSKKKLDLEKEKIIAEGRAFPPGYSRCKECGGLILPGEEHCRKCGAYIENPVPAQQPAESQKQYVEYFECSECGAKVPSDAKVCPKCGAKFDEEE